MQDFLETLYPDASGYITLWTKQNKMSYWFPASDIAPIVQMAERLSASKNDVYFGVGLRREKLLKGRGDNDDVTAIPGFWIDIDIADDAHVQTNLPGSVDDARKLVDEFPLPASILVHSGHGLHAYWLLRELWDISDKTEHARATELMERFQLFIRTQAAARGWKLDSTYDLARVLRLPGTQNYKTDPVPVKVIYKDLSFRFNPDDFDQFLPDIQTPAAGEKRTTRFKRQPSDGPAELLFNNCAFIKQFKDGTRRAEPEWVAAVTNIVRCKDGPAVIHDMVKPFLGDKYSEKTTDEKIRHCFEDMHPQTCHYIQSSLGFTGCPEDGCGMKAPSGWALKKKRKPKKQEPGEQPGFEKLTDLGNAERFVRLFGDKLKYCFQFGSWLIWDGQRHKLDDTGQVMAYAKKTIRQLYVDAQKIENGDIREAVVKHAKQSEKISRLKAMVELAQHMLPVHVDELDSDKWLLNVQNGVIDLRTGQMLQADHNRMITKMAQVKYDTKADCPTFKKFLNDIFPSGPALISFVQRLIGYSLTGDTSEQIMAIAWGNGANGKGTLLNLIQDMLGDYAQTTPTDTLMARRTDSGIPNDIARLRGARFVLASETQEGRRLNEPLIKQMTGQDRMTARFLRCEFFEFMPAFKLILLTNHRPKAQGDDAALWRRIRLIPFTQKFEGDRRDNTLPEKLRKEMPGILKWAIAGCLAWQKEGLNPPPEVVQATNEYRSENDLIGQWIEECCVTEQYAVAKTGDLYQSFINFVQKNGEKTFIGNKNFGKNLASRGFTPFQGGKGVRKMRGIGLLDTQHDSSSEDDSDTGQVLPF